jgi:hypothetical protein
MCITIHYSIIILYILNAYNLQFPWNLHLPFNGIFVCDIQGFSQQCCWGFRSSGLWHSVTELVFLTLQRNTVPTPQHLLILEEYGTVCIITSGNRDKRTVLWPGNPESSNISLHSSALTTYDNFAQKRRHGWGQRYHVNLDQNMSAS